MSSGDWVVLLAVLAGLYGLTALLKFLAALAGG